MWQTNGIFLKCCFVEMESCVNILLNSLFLTFYPSSEGVTQYLNINIFDLTWKFFYSSFLRELQEICNFVAF